ncbi:C2 calcium-dependent domain-containing protein 4A [Ochotona curzoniae]|uniref:C2 calcium-dependent domain-containing protein 4A n=1 Tax=Ochotona curzoniae TaxID=130825 RepID=UPI001B351AB2|nr:C2 calcium-dependent domain-containing protein 4A [Ochotona curzoniae]
MWCLERLGLNPERLLRSGDGLFSGRARPDRIRTPPCVNVLTPDRIPEFCIPPRLDRSLALATLQNSWSEETGTDESAGRTDWDPRSQAALSLPHLRRTRTVYGFCALLESPHTRRKESLLLGSQDAVALRPRAHTYSGSPGGAGGTSIVTPHCSRVSSAALTADLAVPGGHHPPQDTLAPRLRDRRFLRAPAGLLSRALRIPRIPGPARARSVSHANKDVERGANSRFPAPESLTPAPGTQPECLEAEGTMALGRAGCSLRLAAEYSPSSGHLRIRLLPAEGQAGGILEPHSISCRISLVLHSPDSTRKQRRAVLGQSRKAGLDQDFCFDGLTEEQVRRLAVRIKAENKGRGLERGRRLGQGELLLGSLLLL